jgi:hypothetical protein
VKLSEILRFVRVAHFVRMTEQASVFVKLSTGHDTRLEAYRITGIS